VGFSDTSDILEVITNGKSVIVKGFFFDLDGTLVDTHEANFRAYRQAVIDVIGTELGSELKARIKAGESSANFLPALILGLSETNMRKINEIKERHYPDQLHVSRLNEYLSVFLGQMSQHHTIALVTTAKSANARAVLRAHDLEEYFDFMVFGEDVAAMKPSPDAYLLALEKSGLAADEVLAFEDSQKGLDAARAAGIKTIHIRDFL
jgi:beta-phosphoglucomutase